MSEKLDPEEVKEVMGRIFGEIAKIVTQYDGFIEKYVGDAVMAIFGVPKAHEDDPVRAIKAAREIHDLVDTISPQLQDKIDGPLTMHTGINTGLVVTGEVDLEKGTHGVAGETVNLTSRLMNLAQPGEILVASDTRDQAEGHFTFEALEPAEVKGRAEPIQAYKIIAPIERPSKVHRLHGVRADLIGRQAEMAQLGEAVQRLRQGESTIISVCGDAGTGKSRLVEEFKATLDLEKIQWREGHAYAYAQNVPYFPLIDMLSRAWQIEEGDPLERVKEKVESGIEYLIGKRNDVIPYVGSLYALEYSEVTGVNPEFWKAQLYEAIQEILSALAQRAPTVVCLEDLHWADPSSLDLLRFILSGSRLPAIFLCVYRPYFALFTDDQLRALEKSYQEILLEDLSPTEAKDMTESLLKTENTPADLQRFVQERVEGNPFYLEEVINSLIESEVLVPDNGDWRLARSISQSDISPTIHGVISGRLDRLERENKRILQEASVIGRAFFYEILKRVTDLKQDIDRCLTGLERLDLIRTRSLQPDLEYIFKHALTQEVVYNGLLKAERQEIHERIGYMMERLYSHRISEFYEALAFHFQNAKSVKKAVLYLMKSGRKSHRRDAMEESYRYYKEAFNLLSHEPKRTKEENELLIDLLVEWGMVLYRLGRFEEQVGLFKGLEDLCQGLEDKERLGMFHALLGLGLFGFDRFNDSFYYLNKALAIGEDIENQEIISYACSGLTFVCTETGLSDDAITHGKRAYHISRQFDPDHFVFTYCLSGLGRAYFDRGDYKKCFEVGTILLEDGKKYSNIRSLVIGRIIRGFSYHLDGDYTSAIESYLEGIEISKDPWYSHHAKMFLCFSCVANKQFAEADEHLKDVLAFSDKLGHSTITGPSRLFLGAAMVSKGHFSQGMTLLGDVKQSFVEKGAKYRCAATENLFGNIYKTMAERSSPLKLSAIIRNMGFMVKNAPVAKKKAESHFNKAIELSKEFGYKGMLGKSYFDLGVLYRSKNKTDEARKCFSEAIEVFERCESEVFLKQAEEALESLG
jgi:class 3 adenylate cyclase/tetratricopeptide (TPR) repeat protein